MVRRAFAVLILAVFASLLWAKDPAPPSGAPTAADPRLTELLARMDQVQKGLTTLRVNFVQTNTFRMLSQPQVLKGQLVLRKPDTALYEYTSPSKLFFLVKDGDLLVYNPAQKKVIIQDIRRHQARIIRYLGISQPLRELQESFEVKWSGQDAGVVHLILTPTKLKMRRKIAVLQFWVDPADGASDKLRGGRGGGRPHPVRLLPVGEQPRSTRERLQGGYPARGQSASTDAGPPGALSALTLPNTPMVQGGGMLDLVLRAIRAILASLYMLFEGMPAIEALRSWFGEGAAGAGRAGILTLVAAAAILSVLAFLCLLWLLSRRPARIRGTRVSGIFEFRPGQGQRRDASSREGGEND